MPKHGSIETIDISSVGQNTWMIYVFVGLAAAALVMALVAPLWRK